MSKLSEMLLKPKVKIGLFGLGCSNRGVLEYIKQKNPSAVFTLRSDKISENSQDAAFDKIFLSNNALSDIEEDILFLSPSVRRDRAELRLAESKGVILSSDAELFFEHSRADIFSVTGSDGKSTTTHLISDILSRSGINAVPCGNYGRSLTSLLISESLAVAELSSFQLMYMKPKSKRAVITNITPNHLNWHKSLEEYISSKLNIIENAEELIIDFDSDILRSIPPDGIFAAVSMKHDFLKLKELISAENYITYHSGAVHLNGSPYFEVKEAVRCETYNIKNYMLASGAAIGFASRGAIEESVRAFRGLAHRAETVCSKNGITYINSSIDSSPERTLRTLEGMSGNIAVIITGMSKGLSLKELAMRLPSLTRGAVLMGEVGEELGMLLSQNPVRYNFEMAKCMEEAIEKCERMIAPCGTVLLSPAATSFDMYRNFEERGMDFQTIVSKRTN